MWNSDLDDVYNNSQCLELDTKFVWDFEWISSTRLVASTYEGMYDISYMMEEGGFSSAVLFYLAFSSVTLELTSQSNVSAT
jgi:hypothetical protein